VAVLFPLRSVWAHLHAGCRPLTREEEGQAAFAGFGSPDRLLLSRVERDLLNVCDLLGALHFDFDLVDEWALSQARIENSRLVLGMERYELLVLPSVTTCAEATWECVRAFFDAGGNLLSCGLLPFQTGEGPEADARLRASVQALTTVDPTAPDRPGGSTARSMGRDAMRPLNVNRQHGSRVARYLPARVPLPDHRVLLMETLLRTLAAVDVDIACPHLLCHQRQTTDGKLFFLVNASDEPCQVDAVFYALGHPEEWNAENGEVRRLWQYRRSGEKVTLPLRFAPWQTRVIVFTGSEDVRVERANFAVTAITEQEENYLVEGVAWSHARPMDTPPNCSLAWPGGGRWAEGVDKGLLEPIRFGDVWDLRVLGDNYLVLPPWRWHTPRPGETLPAPGSFPEHWPELNLGETAYDLSDFAFSEPRPLGEVWFQTRFFLDSPVQNLSLLLEPLEAPYSVLVNGEAVTPVRTGVLDPQFLTAEIGHLVAAGENVVTVCVTSAAAAGHGGLRRVGADQVPQPARVMGDFTAVPDEDAGFRLYPGAPPRIATGSWTKQGFPHYSGTLEYTQPVMVTRDYFEFQLVLTVERPAESIEVLVNGKRAGRRLWPPFEVDVSDLLFMGTNLVTLRVTNTAVNALLGRQQPSGLLGPVEIRPYARLSVVVPKELGG
ncbi:MAG: hypothetical protein QHJ73_14325, partial [Armatimonadota bacterium]|nr:hypothetical protein [Armatimonadota bacterium]